MDRYLLKNIIITILILVNGFLLGALVLRFSAQETSRRQIEEQLVALFAADQITLSRDAISRQEPPPALSLNRSTELEAQAAAFFLGDSAVAEDQGGGIVTYTAAAGTAVFRSNGSFEIRGILATEDIPSLCESFCRTFSYEDPSFVSPDEKRTTGTALCLYDKLPVCNGSVTFTAEDGILTSVSGTLLPKEGVPAGENLLSATAALTAFQQMRRETSAACSAVTEMYLCYELQSSAAAAVSLVPSWCVVTDIANYYVNCSTGAITVR